MRFVEPVASSSRGPWLLGAACLVVVVLAWLLVVSGVSEPVDAAIAGAVRSEALRGVLAPLRYVTELGSTWAVVTVAVALLVLGTRAGQARDAALGAGTIGLVSLAVEIVKRVVSRARPEILDPIVVETGFAFPSGHAANAMVAYGIVAVVIGRSSLARPWRTGIQVLLAVVIGLVGLSRVWLGVHHPTDVVAGWATGAFAVCAYVALTRSGWPARGAAAAPADRAGRRSGPPAAG